MPKGRARQEEKAEAFAALHRAGIFVMPNPWDVGSARLLAAAGFAALATTSAGHAFATGRRDGGVGREAMLAHVAELAAAVDLPLSADLENGYGDAPEAVAETLRQAAAAGAVGGSIEDYTGRSDQPIYDFALAVERVAAAVEAVRALPFPFTLTARAENFLYGRTDLDDTIRRLQAFEAAGADVLYAPGLRAIEDIAAVCQAVSRPVNVLAVPGLGLGDLAAAGVRRVSVGSALQRLTVTTLMRAARATREEGGFAWVAEATPFGDISPHMAEPAVPAA